MDEILFRGWSSGNKEWMYGYLYKEPLGKRFYIHNDSYERVCEPDSIGVYINKNDKNGNKIFCSCNGAKYGSDIIKTRANCTDMKEALKCFGEEAICSDCEFHKSSTHIIKYGYGGGFGWDGLFCKYEGGRQDSFEETIVVSTQWEERLKGE